MNIVKFLRRSQEFDMTQEELAKVVGVSKVTISAIEKGGNTSGEIMLKIAKVFRRDPREIFFVDDVIYEITNSVKESVTHD